MNGETKNLCTTQGICTAENGGEGACDFCKPSQMTGFCVYRAWYQDKCLSPFALLAARANAAAKAVAA